MNDHIGASDPASLPWTVTELSRVSASDAVFSDLRSAIRAGRLGIGERLPSEATLADEYGVSRPVVREALRSLQALGLTETKVGRGTYIRAAEADAQLNLGGFSDRDLMEARPLIETPAAMYAAARGQRDEIAAIRATLNAMLEAADTAEWVRLDNELHAGIARASGNPVFVVILATIRDSMTAQSELISRTRYRTQDSDREHAEIVEAIEARDGERAAVAMATHLHRVATAVGLITGEKKN